MTTAKRILSAVFVAALALGGVACGGDDAGTDVDVEETIEEPAEDAVTEMETEMEMETEDAGS